MIQANQALQAYAKTQQLNKTSLPTPQSQAPGLSFQDVLGSLKGVIAQSREAEQVAMQGVTGTADPLAVITALNKAHLNLQTISTLTSKTIQVLQDIKNTPL